MILHGNSRNKMTPLQKFGLDVKTDGTIHTQTGCEQFIRHLQERTSHMGQKKDRLEKARRKPGLGVSVVAEMAGKGKC